LVAYADDVPLLGALRTSAVIGAFPPREDPRGSERTDLGLRSDDAPRRAPPSRKPGCLSPSRDAKEYVAERLLPPAFAPALSLTPPALGSQGWGRCFDWALQGTAAVTRLVRAFRECRRLCYSLELVPGADDPSTPSSSTDSAVDGDRLPRSHRCRSQRLDGFYDREGFIYTNI
jgi:hypothetical protein